MPRARAYRREVILPRAKLAVASVTVAVVAAVMPAASLADGPGVHSAGKTRTYSCGALSGAGTRGNPIRVPSRNYRRTIVRSCPGFPLGQGAPTFFLWRVPSRIDNDDFVSLWTRPTASHPAEVSMAIDDLSATALNIRGIRAVDGSDVGRYLYLASIPQLTVGPWYLRAQRLRAVSSSNGYYLIFDFR
jgi:hypothetical protein